MDRRKSLPCPACGSKHARQISTELTNGMSFRTRWFACECGERFKTHEFMADRLTDTDFIPSTVDERCLYAFQRLSYDDKKLVGRIMGRLSKC